MKGFEGAFPAHPGSDLGQYYADRPPTDRIANRFAAILARAAEAPTGLIHLIEGSERMTLAGASGLMAGWVMPEPVMVKSMVVGIVVSCGHPVMIADILDDPRVPEDALALKLGMRSYVGFPIRGDRQQTIGVCSVVDYQPREWSARELTAVDEAAQAYSEFLAAQRHSENQRRFLDTVLQNIAHGVVACDEDGRITFANSSIQRMYNVTSVGHSIWERAGRSPLADLDRRLISDDEMPLTRVLGGEVLRDIEYLVPDPDGSVRRVSIDAQPILGGDGRRQGAVATVYDVTERWRVQRFREVERSVAETLVHADSPQQAAPPVLAAVCTGFDWPYAEFWLAERDTDTLTLIARHPAEAPGEPEPDIVTRKAWQTGKPAWATDLTNDTEATPRTRTSLAIPATSGARVLAVLSFAATTAADSSTDSLIGLLSGIGAHVAEFLERRRAENLTVELARNKDEYLGLVGHELRTPITSITAYVEMLRDTDPAAAAEEVPDLLDVLSRNSDALQEIVDRLLDLVALDSGHTKLIREPVDLTEVVSAATEAAQPAADAAGLNLTLHLRPDTTVAGDAARLRQVADQLLDNAVKHTPSGGRVTVTLTRPDPATAELTVTDTGMGIPVEDHPRLFDRFYRSQRTRDRHIPGSGLGLPVTLAIVEAHRGQIRYAPSEAGTQVTVRLPIA